MIFDIDLIKHLAMTFEQWIDACEDGDELRIIKVGEEETELTAFQNLRTRNIYIFKLSRDG